MDRGGPWLSQSEVAMGLSDRSEMKHDTAGSQPPPLWREPPGTRGHCSQRCGQEGMEVTVCVCVCYCVVGSVCVLSAEMHILRECDV